MLTHGDKNTGGPGSGHFYILGDSGVGDFTFWAMTPSFIKRVTRRFQSRLECVVAARGGRIE